MDPLQSALSGIQSAHARIGISAHNLANLGTDEFKPLYARQVSRSEGGSEVHLQQDPNPRDVDVARELVDQMLASHQAEASARVVETVNELKGTIIDMVA